jgi:hypothetical protein
MDKERSLLQRYAGKPDPASPDSNVIELDPVDDLGCFGWLRGLRERAPMLELRKRTGNRLAVAYGWIERIEFDPSEGITLRAPGLTVRIVGSNLNAEVRPSVRLFEGLTRHRVTWVSELPSPTSIESDPMHWARVDHLEWD